MIIIYCDECGKEIYVLDYRDDDEQDEDVEKNGWWTNGKKHLCNSCRKEENKEAENEKES